MLTMAMLTYFCLVGIMLTKFFTWDEKCSVMSKLVTGHYEVNINVFIKLHCNSSNSCWDISGWNNQPTDIAGHRAMLLAWLKKWQNHGSYSRKWRHSSMQLHFKTKASRLCIFLPTIPFSCFNFVDLLFQECYCLLNSYSLSACLPSKHTYTSAECELWVLAIRLICFPSHTFTCNQTALTL